MSTFEPGVVASIHDEKLKLIEGWATTEGHVPNEDVLWLLKELRTARADCDSLRGKFEAAKALLLRHDQVRLQQRAALVDWLAFRGSLGSAELFSATGEIARKTVTAANLSVTHDGP